MLPKNGWRFTSHFQSKALEFGDWTRYKGYLNVPGTFRVLAPCDRTVVCRPVRWLVRVFAVTRVLSGPVPPG